VETWEHGPADCECLYDLDIQVNDLPPGTYGIKLSGSLGGLDVHVDLVAEPSGSYCEPRDRYPWGL
jgi:hypothetical protein